MKNTIIMTVIAFSFALLQSAQADSIENMQNRVLALSYENLLDCDTMDGDLHVNIKIIPQTLNSAKAKTEGKVFPCSRVGTHINCSLGLISDISINTNKSRAVMGFPNESEVDHYVVAGTINYQTHRQVKVLCSMAAH